MCLFLFLDFLPQLLFNDRPLTVLVSAQPIFKNPRKLREQTNGRHADRRISQPAAVIVLQQSCGIHICKTSGGVTQKRQFMMPSELAKVCGEIIVLPFLPFVFLDYKKWHFLNFLNLISRNCLSYSFLRCGDIGKRKWAKEPPLAIARGGFSTSI